MNCPTCDGEMETTHVLGIEVDMCSNCGGVWLDNTEFEELFGTVKCPNCGKVMFVNELRGVEFDSCPSCGGVYLDSGELGLLVQREPYQAGRESHLSRFLNNSIVTRNVLIAHKETVNRLDTSDPVIDEIFLVHETGTLIAHATRRLKPDQDDAVLSAMLVAIQGFVQESFKDEGDATLREIAFGSHRILLEKGRWVLLAVVVSEEVEVDQDDLARVRGEMTEVVMAVEDQFKAVLEEWDGFMERFRGARDIISRIFQ